MARFKMQDGRVGRFEVPEGTSPEQAQGLIEDHLKNSPVEKPEPVGIPRTILDQGMQGLTFGLGDEASDALGAVGAKLMGGNATKDMSIGDLYGQARDLSKDQLSNEMKQNPLTSIASQLGGGLVTGGAISDVAKGTALANMLRSSQVAKDAPTLAKAGNLAINMGKSGAIGSATGAAYGFGTADDGERLQGTGQGAKVGAVVGGLMPVANAAVNKIKEVVSPTVSAGMQDVAELAKKHGVPLGVDQLTNSPARKYLAETSAELPFSGGSQFAAKQQSAFNNAVLKTVGESGDRITPEVVGNAYKNIGQKFDDVLAGKTLQVSPDHLDSLGNIIEDAKGTLANDKVSAIKNTIDKLIADIHPDGSISGEKIGDIRSTLVGKIKRADPGIKEYLGDVLDTVMNISTEGNPETRKLLTEARYQYKNLKTLEPLMAKATDGDISPALLKNRVISNYGAKSMATGEAGDLGELARVGDAIKSKIGNSGTAQRAASMALLATPGAIIGGAATPGDYYKKAMGAALGGAATLGAAKGYQSYNNSPALAEALLSARNVKNLPPNISTALIGALNKKK